MCAPSVDSTARLLGHRGTPAERITIRCPAHDDRTASLSIWRGDDAFVLWSCKAITCDVYGHPERLSDAVDVPFSELRGYDVGCPVHGHDQPLGWHDGLLAFDPDAEPYQFDDGEREIVYAELRRPERGDRAWLASVVDGEWRRGLHGPERYLWRLTRLREEARDRIVWLAEGARKAAAIEAQGELATAHIGGAGGWRREYVEQLVAAGAWRVHVVPDPDPEGLRWAAQVRATLAAHGIEVWILRPPATA